MKPHFMSVIALYVQKGETPYRQYFQDNLAELQRGFQRYQYNLLYLLSITRSDSPSFNEGLRQYLEIYYPSFKRLSAIQQQQALFIVAATSREEDVYRQLDEMFHLNLRDGAYIFYIKPGPEYKEELHQIYLSMATHTDTAELTRRVKLLCDPRDNSINEKLSTINRIFSDLLGSENCTPYQILGVRGAVKKINLRREYVLL